jgi:Fusaric acid resistance protein family
MEQTTIGSRLLSALPSGWRIPAPLRRFYAEAAWLQQLVTEELRPRPGRIRTSVRMAFIAAVGIALMAALHVGPGLGPVLLWVALYGSDSAFTVSGGLMLIAAYAVMLIASVFLAGVLVDFPWLLLPFLAIAAGSISYAFKKQGFVGAWSYMVVAFLDTFYLCVFDPQNFGWSVAYTFSGVAVGIGVLVAFDTVLWPDPAEPKLLHSLADTLDRQRERLAAIGRAYFYSGAATEWPQPAVVSILPVHLPLLERAKRELKNPQREAILLAAVTITERLHNEIERLLAIARDNVGRDIRARLRPEIEAVLQAIAAALQQYAHQAATGLKAVDDPAYEVRFKEIRANLDALQTREDLILNQLRSADAAAVANVGAFTQSLRRIGERLLNHPIGYVYGLAFSKERKSDATRSGAVDRPLMRYSAKLGLAATLGFVVGVASHRSELSVIVWTAVMAGLPTYGGTLRRMILRVAGGVIGGLLALAIIIVVSPNFQSVEWYLAAFFVVLFICAYVGLSSGRLAYAGQQGGLAFVVAYAALSPSANFYEPLWRVWGIFLGLVILGLVFLLIAPEYAANAIAPRLAGLLRSALELVRPAAGVSEERLQEIDMQATLHLRELLGVAEDARMEGRHSRVNPDRVIDAAGTLRRIVHRLSGIVIARLLHRQPALPAEFQAARAACETALRYHLQSWLEVLEDEHGPDRRRITEVAARFTPDHLTLPLEKLREHLSASGLRELASWPAAARSALLAEIESYRRLVVLMTELNQQFAEIPAAIR